MSILPVSSSSYPEHTVTSDTILPIEIFYVPTSALNEPPSVYQSAPTTSTITSTEVAPALEAASSPNLRIEVCSANIDETHNASDCSESIGLLVRHGKKNSTPR